MTEVLELTNIGLKGIATDPMPWTLPPEFINYGKNFRIFAGAIENNGGETLWSTAGVAFNPGHLFPVRTSDGDIFWVALGRSAVYVYNGLVWTDITSVAGYAGISTDDELLWHGCQLGQIPIFNNPQHVPEYWSPVSLAQVLQPLQFDASNTWSAKGYSAKVMRSHKNYLFAMNLAEGAVELPDSYRWSHPADINGLPATWDETDESFLAGKSALGGDGGQIIDGLSLRDAFSIYSEKAVNILDSTNDEFVWRRRNLSSTIGLAARNAVSEVKGTHFLLVGDDIVKNDGNRLDSIMHNRFQTDLSSRIDATEYPKSYSLIKNDRKEIWFCIPETGSSYPNIAYVYNWKDDSWAIRDIFTGIAHSASGPQAEASAADTWDGISGTWDEQTRKWDEGGVSPLTDTIVGVVPGTQKLYLMDTSDVPDANIDFTIERTNFPLLGHRQVTTITRVYPHIRSESPVTIEFGSQDYPDGAVRWKPSITFDPSTERKIDIRTTGELHAWRISALNKSAIKMSGMTIEYVLAGHR